MAGFRISSGSDRRHLTHSRLGQPCANGSLLSFSLHFLNEMVPMRIFRSRHASDIVDIQTGECIPAIWQEFVKGDAFFSVSRNV